MEVATHFRTSHVIVIPGLARGCQTDQDNECRDRRPRLWAGRSSTSLRGPASSQFASLLNSKLASGLIMKSQPKVIVYEKPT